ncbi:unnamed protein product, partial [Phaeothamnion confervicola]
MAKGNKRQRKFQKKGGLVNSLQQRREHKAKAKIRARQENHKRVVAERDAEDQSTTAAADHKAAAAINAATGAGVRNRGLRPAGVDLEEFLECSWLFREGETQLLAAAAPVTNFAMLRDAASGAASSGALDTRGSALREAAVEFVEVCAVFCSQRGQHWHSNSSGKAAASQQDVSPASAAAKVCAIAASMLGAGSAGAQGKPAGAVAAGAGAKSGGGASDTSDSDDSDSDSDAAEPGPANSAASKRSSAPAATAAAAAPTAATASSRPFEGMARLRMEKARKWPAAEAPLQAYLAALLAAVDAVSCAASGTGATASSIAPAAVGGGRINDVAAVLDSLVSAAPLLQPFPDLSAACLRALLQLMTGGAAGGLPRPALAAALGSLRHFLDTLPTPERERAMRGVYLAYRAVADALSPDRAENGNDALAAAAAMGTVATTASGTAGAAAAGAAVGAGSAGVSWRMGLLRGAVAVLYAADPEIAELHAYVALHDLQRDLVAADAEV